MEFFLESITMIGLSVTIAGLWYATWRAWRKIH
jgi:hypothetical protein